MARQVVEQVSCDVEKCKKPSPAETFRVVKLSRTYEVDLCPTHERRVSIAEAVRIGRDITKLREAERIIPTDRQELIDSLKS